MFDHILYFSIRQRYVVLLLVAACAFLGIYSYPRLPIDAVPDITNVQVQINTEAAGYSPQEVEQRITFPIENALAGLPQLGYTRSLSRYGLSQVTVVFEEDTDIYFARQLVNERLQEARSHLPVGIVPVPGPIATGLGEIYMYTVEAKAHAKKADGTAYNETDLRTVQDWIIRPQLRTVPGVTEVNSIGGYVKQFLVAPDPMKLIAYGLTLEDLVAALRRNNLNTGAGYIEYSGEQYLVRLQGQVVNLAQIGAVVVATHQGVPVSVRDIANLSIDHELRTGAATRDGREVVLGTVLMLMGENSRAVAARVDAKMTEIRRGLPAGIVARTQYDRSHLVDAVIATVKMNLFEGAVLVIAVLFLLLGNLRAALITAMVIPLSMLFTITGMVQQKVSANLMSLGALDFGIIVDGAVVIVENAIRCLAEKQRELRRALTQAERFEVVFQAAREVRQVLLFAQLIIIAVYLPVFGLQGIEGKMFNPMAFTVTATLLGAMLLTITFIPAAIALFIRQPVEEKESRVMQATHRYYAMLLNAALAHRWHVIGIAVILFLLSSALFMRMGSEFIPSLREGDWTLHALRIPGTSLTQAVAMQHQLEKKIMELPEVKTVFSKIGTGDIANDPMPPSVADNYVMMKPTDEWPDPDKSPRQFLLELQAKTAEVSGNNYEFTQPIEMRFNELISGVRTDIGIKLFGDDLEQLLQTGNEIVAVVEGIPGAADVKLEPITGLPVLTLRMKPDVMARYGLNADEVQHAVATALAGETAGQIFEGDQRFDIVVRLSAERRNNPVALGRLPIALPGALSGKQHYVPLEEIVAIDLKPGPNQISRENGKRRAVITANVRDRDIASFVYTAQQRVQEKIKIPPGYWLGWGGTFEQMQHATQRLAIIVPITLILILVLLYAALGNLKDGLLVFTGVPFALTGGVLALALGGLPFSISAAVGFIALSGVAVLNGLVMLSRIRQLRETGLSPDTAIREGAALRLRPVLITALVASLGFVPMALALGIGAEVQRPLATVVIGGIVSSTILTLLVLPVLYAWAYQRKVSIV